MAEFIERDVAYRAFSADDVLSGYEKAYCMEIIKKIPAAIIAPDFYCGSGERKSDNE